MNAAPFSLAPSTRPPASDSHSETRSRVAVNEDAQQLWQQVFDQAHVIEKPLGEKSSVRSSLTARRQHTDGTARNSTQGHANPERLAVQQPPSLHSVAQYLAVPKNLCSLDSAANSSKASEAHAPSEVHDASPRLSEASQRPAPENITKQFDQDGLELTPHTFVNSGTRATTEVVESRNTMALIGTPLSAESFHVYPHNGGLTVVIRDSTLDAVKALRCVHEAIRQLMGDSSRLKKVILNGQSILDFAESKTPPPSAPHQVSFDC